MDTKFNELKSILYKISRFRSSVLTLMVLLGISNLSTAQEWTSVTDATALTALFTEKEHKAVLTNNVEATSVYNSDGTGLLSAWGDQFERKWKVEDKKVAILVDNTCDF